MQEVAFLFDNGGRRAGVERRQFVYAGHIPERRSGIDRRSGIERRSGEDRRNGIPSNVIEMVDWKERRNSVDRRRLLSAVRGPQVF